MGPSKSSILNADLNAYLCSVDDWRCAVGTLESQVSKFKGYVDRPAGTYWEGAFAEGAQQNAAGGLKTVVKIRDTVDKLVGDVARTIVDNLLPSLSAARAIINRAAEEDGVTVNEDLSITYVPGQGVSQETIDRRRRSVDALEQELKGNAEKWWAASEIVKNKIETAQGVIAGELNIAAGLFNVTSAISGTPTSSVTVLPCCRGRRKSWYPDLRQRSLHPLQWKQLGKETYRRSWMV